jgi:anti-sigma B factor antagonist
MDFEFSETKLSPRRVLITCAGRLNAASAPGLKARMHELVGLGHIELVCDLSAVSFLDSSGLAALVSGLKSTREVGGWIKLAGMNPLVRNIFALTKLERVFESYPDVEAALSSDSKAN